MSGTEPFLDQSEIVRKTLSANLPLFKEKMGNSASSSGASPAVHVDAAVLEKLEARAAAAEAKIARLEAAKGANPAAPTPPTPSAAQVTAAYANELQSLRLVLVAAEKEHEALVKQVKELEEKNGGWP